MHDACLNFVRTIAIPTVIDTIVSPRVLEIGSRNINGSTRELFNGSTFYVGTDKNSGPGVDIVCEASKLDGGKSYDCVVCTSVMEHTQHPQDIVQAAWRALKGGGIFILTTVCDPFGKHSEHGGTDLHPGEWYRNVPPEEVRDMLAGWEQVNVLRSQGGDVFACAVKPT